MPCAAIWTTSLALMRRMKALFLALYLANHEGKLVILDEAHRLPTGLCFRAYVG